MSIYGIGVRRCVRDASTHNGKRYGEVQYGLIHIHIQSGIMYKKRHSASLTDNECEMPWPLKPPPGTFPVAFTYSVSFQAYKRMDTDKAKEELEKVKERYGLSGDVKNKQQM